MVNIEKDAHVKYIRKPMENNCFLRFGGPDGAGNRVWRVFGDWLDVVWGSEAVCWRLVAGCVRPGP